jgi:hypothetical protein
MSYKSDTIATILNQLNLKYFLPAIQREYVWQPAQILKLFDSIMRGYPISSFLFWQLKPENQEKWEVYNFINNFKPGQHNELANTNGVQQLTLVLDGQQRLTSLLIGLKGSYTIKLPRKFWNNPNAWRKQQLYLDLLKDSTSEDDTEDSGMRYGFEFLDAQPTNTLGHYWLKVGHILKFDSKDAFDNFKDTEEEKLPENTTRKEIKIFRNNLDRLYDTIWKEDFISYYIENDQNYDRVLDIFVRANEGGTKLSKSDLLLSMVTSKWSGINAREEIFGFVDHLNLEMPRRNNLDKDFVMKACLVLTDLPVQYRVENFSNKNLELIRSHWEAIQQAIVATLQLVNTFGIDENSLTSANALIPIAYYAHKHGFKTLIGSSAFDLQNATVLRQWLTTALLNGVFGGQSDNVLRDIRNILQEQVTSSKLYPVEAINLQLAKTNRLTSFTGASLEDFLLTSYGRRETFLALTLLYDENSWGNMSFHQDHIFPRALFTPERLTELGIPASKHSRYLELVNRIGNLQLLLAHENIGKSDTDFEPWLATRGPDFRQKHLIPSGDHLLKLENFEAFIEARENLIRQRLKNLFTLAELAK